MTEFQRVLTYQSQDAQSGATISDCKLYRYELWRRWDPTLNFVKWFMLNPSTADDKLDDPTIKKCIKFAKTWGYGGIRVVNLFAYRATDPKELKKLSYAEAVGPSNNVSILRALNTPGPNIAAWGQGGKLWSRAHIVLTEVLKDREIPLGAMKLSKDGTPWHPLYLRDDARPFTLEYK